MKFLKYEYTPVQWEAAKKKIELTGTDPEGETYTYYNPELVTAVVELGKLCIEWKQSEEGPLCAKQSTKVSVDILWADQPLTTSFAPYVVWPEPCGIHVFAGHEQEYAAEYCKANPTAPYCKAPAPIEP
jgi:hypothetical protein